MKNGLFEDYLADAVKLATGPVTKEDLPTLVDAQWKTMQDQGTTLTKDYALDLILRALDMRGINLALTRAESYDLTHEPTKTPREKALDILTAENCTHVIYGYRGGTKTMEASWPNEFLRFWDDETFAVHVDKMQAEIPGLNEIFAVHRR